MIYKRKTFYEDYIKELNETMLNEKINSITEDDRQLYKDKIYNCKSKNEFYEYIDEKCLELRSFYEKYEKEMNVNLTVKLSTIATTINTSSGYFLEFLDMTGCLAKKVGKEDLKQLCINIFDKMKTEMDTKMASIMTEEKNKISEKISKLFVIAYMYYNEIIKELPDYIIEDESKLEEIKNEIEISNGHSDINVNTKESMNETSSR